MCMASSGKSNVCDFIPIISSLFAICTFLLLRGESERIAWVGVKEEGCQRVGITMWSFGKEDIRDVMFGCEIEHNLLLEGTCTRQARETLVCSAVL